jgi:hypothetical protein
MLRKEVGWLLATATTHIPFQNSDTEKGNKQQTQKQKLASCFALSKKIHPFAVNFSTILLQFVNLCCCCCCFRRRRRRLREPCFVYLGAEGGRGGGGFCSNNAGVAAVVRGADAVGFHLRVVFHGKFFCPD